MLDQTNIEERVYNLLCPTMDIRTQATIAKLCAALLDLVQQYEYQELNVSLLTNYAQVSRKSFYQHFTNIDEFFQLVNDLVVLGYDKFLNSIRPPYVYRKYYVAIFEYYYRLGPAFHKLFSDLSYRTPLYNMIEQTANEMLDYFQFFDKNLDSQMVKALGYYITGGSILTVQKMVVANPNQDLDEMMELIYIFATRSLGLVVDLERVIDPDLIAKRAKRHIFVP